MNICGVLVHCAPDTTDAIAERLAKLPGVEVHLKAPDARLVITVEDTGKSSAGDQILEVHRMPGVISAALTYHHFEELGATPAASANA